MTLPPIYSRRKRQAEAAGSVDVYQYETTTPKFRVQVVQILQDAIGPFYNKNGYRCAGADVYDHLVRQIRRELGVHELVPGYLRQEASEEFFAWMSREVGLESWLDATEMALQFIDRFVRQKFGLFQRAVRCSPDDAIAEFNARALESGFGYQFVSGEIVQINSQYLHSEVVIPALTLLAEKRFEAVNIEYRSAHQAYRHGEYEDCLVDCGKAFESVLKVIGGKRGWLFKDNDPASKLIQAAVDAGFLPAFSQAALNHLKGLIESSTPTLRNKMGGHGAGERPREVPQHLAAFQLHQTAAVILFLVEQDATLPP
jgi:hypothetical protein